MSCAAFDNALFNLIAQLRIAAGLCDKRVQHFQEFFKKWFRCKMIFGNISKMATKVKKAS